MQEMLCVLASTFNCATWRPAERLHRQFQHTYLQGKVKCGAWWGVLEVVEVEGDVEHNAEAKDEVGYRRGGRGAVDDLGSSNEGYVKQRSYRRKELTAVLGPSHRHARTAVTAA